jgi:hypothetical protein
MKKKITVHSPGMSKFSLKNYQPGGGGFMGQFSTKDGEREFQA